MKFKKSMLILILAVFLISIAGVCASDANDAAMASQEYTAMESTYENLQTVEDSEPAVNTTTDGEILYASVDDEIVGAENDLDELSANPGTYSGLSSEIGSGGNITLTHDYYTYDNGSTIVISIDNSVIDGNGAIVDMGRSNMRAFYVTASGVTIKNLTIKNGKVDDNGGAVYFEKTATVENCNFINNDASKLFGGGGAIYINGAGNVINCNFVNNTASGFVGNGGAIYINGAGNVINCNFTNNKAGSLGGAVLFKENGYLKNCNFAKNYVDEYGGAVLFREDGAIENCNFTNNNAGDHGGAVWFTANGTVENSSFVKNSAYYSYGGGIYFYTNGEVTNCNFTNNKAVDAGAVEFCEYGEVTNCNFINNSGDFGGAVSFDQGGKLYNSNFTNNSGGHGGAVYFHDNGIVEKSNFNDNSASYGGAIMIIDSITVKNCSFNDNCASNGGAVFINYNGVVTDCNFINNSATVSGGAIHLNNASDVVVSSCVFVKNSADYGIILFNNEEYGSNLTVNDNIFLNNDCVAIYFVKSDSTSNVDYNWFGNNATNYDMEPVTNNAEINAWLFLNATANPSSIPILGSSDIVFELYAYNSSEVSEYDNSRLKAINLTLTPTNGRVNTAMTGFGDPVRYNPDSFGIGMLTAAIENVIYTATLKIVDGTTFCDLYYLINSNDNDTIVLDRDYTYNSTFDHNFNNGIVINRLLTIVGNGHALNAAGLARIFNVKADDVTISNITFANGKIDGNNRGGAIYWNEGANGVVSGCSFVNNSANMYGGAINWNEGANGVVSDCSFVNNSARFGGGAIYWNGANGVVSGCSFVNNYVKTYGGAIYWCAANGNVSDCSFVNNSADYAGAILWNGAANGVVSGCSFANHSVKRYGGAIHWNEAEDGVVSGCSFVNGSSDRGGAIYWDLGARGVVSGCSFVNCSSNRSGAVYWYANDGFVSGCSFVNNSGDKGVIYFANSNHQNLSINDNIFLNSDGVAIYFVNNDSTSNADYNWFGNNATNYDIEPTTNNVTINTWLFLNATANPNPVEILELSDVSFKLYSYNATGTSGYDSSRLQPVNLTLTATNGDVDGIAKLGETVKFNATSLGTGSVTAKIENTEYTIEIDIKRNPNLSVESNEVTYSNNTVIVLDYNSTATGKVNITLNGKKSDYTFADFDLNATISLGDIGADEYDVIVEYCGDEIFTNATATGTLTVNKANSTLTVNDIEFVYNDTGSGEVSFTGAIAVVAEVVNQPDAVVNVTGNTITVSNLNVGKYTLAVTTIPDDNHDAVTKTATITVNKITPNLSVSAGATSNGVVVVNVNSDSNFAYRVNVTVGNQSKLLRLKDGKGTLKFTDLEDGTYDVVALYKGDSEYEAVSANSSVEVKNKRPNLTVSASAGGNGVLVVNVTSDSNFAYRVNVTVGDHSKLLRLKDGAGTLKFTDLEDGTYTVVALYKGDADYAPESVNVSVEIKRISPNITVSASAGSNGIVVVNVTCDDDLANRVNVTIGNQSKLLRLTDGTGTLKFDGLENGNYSVVALYKGDADYAAVSANASVEVKTLTPDIAVSASADSDGNVIVNVTSDSDLANRVNVTVGNQSKLLRLKDGAGTLKFTDLEAGTYDVVALYKGDANFSSVSAITSIEVNK